MEMVYHRVVFKRAKRPFRRTDGLLAQLVQCLEVEMAESLVPVPHFIITARGEAEWPSHLEMEDIETVRTVRGPS